MRIGRRPQGAPDPEGTRPGWLPFGCLLALCEAVVLVLVVAHASGIGTRPPSESLAASVGDVGHGDGATPEATTTTLPPDPTTVPTTTLPSTPVPAEPTVPTTTVPAAPPVSPTPASAERGIVPPAVPPANIPPDPNFLQSCSGSTYDDSAGCTDATLQAIAHARATEGLAPMTLPANWAQLTPEEQLFVATNLERTARGLAPLTAMASALDATAGQGAAQDQDPSPPASFPYSEWGSNWAGAVGNPLEAVYLWMYDDGVGSANVDCTASNQSGCWGHRKNMLLRLPCQECVMGTGWVANGYSGDPSMTELLVETSGDPAVDFTWHQESAYLS